MLFLQFKNFVEKFPSLVIFLSIIYQATRSCLEKRFETNQSNDLKTLFMQEVVILF